MLGVEVQVVQAEMMPVLALLEKINRLVDGDAVKPGVKTGAAFEGGQRLISLDEGFLREVVGILVIAGHVINRGVDAFLIAPDQLIVSAKIFALSAFYQFQVPRPRRRTVRVSLDIRWRHYRSFQLHCVFNSDSIWMGSVQLNNP